MRNADTDALHDSHADDRIQTSLPPIAREAPSEPDIDPAPSPRGPLAAGMLFGAFVGLCMGPPVAGAACWLTDWYEGLTLATYLGAAVGPLGGAVIGMRQPRSRGIIIVRPEIATVICAGYGVLPALLVLAASFTTANGTFSILIGVGMVFMGPMLGMLIGARGYAPADAH